MTNLEKLKHNREFILVAELGALIHDIGKLDERWPKKSGGKYRHEQAILDMDICRQDIRSLLKGENYLKGFVNQLNNAGFECLNDFILFHSERDRKGPLRKIIRLADLWSATEDRAIKEGELTQEEKDKDSYPHYFSSDPFGCETLVDRSRLNEIRGEIEDALKKCAQQYPLGADFAVMARDLIYGILQNSEAIASTIRPSNDVTLFDHSYSTSSIFKVLLNQWILGKEVTSKDPWDESLEDQVGIYAVIFDVPSLANQVEKIGDMQGRRLALESIQDQLKRLLEIDYAVGSEIYRELGLSCFLVPVQFSGDSGCKELNVFLEERLAEICKDEELIIPFGFKSTATRRVHEALPGILGAARGMTVPANRWLVEYVEEQWEEAPRRAESCPLCGLLPSEVSIGRSRSQRLCSLCNRLRQRGQQERRDFPGTVWMDEIADLETGRVALLSLEVPLEWWLDNEGMIKTQQYKFKNVYSKTTSYERLRRIWSVTDKYLDKVWEEIEQNLGECTRLQMELCSTEGPSFVPGQFYNVEGPENTELYYDTGGIWRTVSKLRNPKAWKPEKQLHLSADRPGADKISAFIEKVEEEKYSSVALVERTRNRLVVIVPARKARRAALSALNLFESCFPKSQGKIPLAVGVLYAPCQHPLSMLLKATLDMQAYLCSRANELSMVEIQRDVDDNPENSLAEIVFSSDLISEDTVSLKIDTWLGDNQTGSLGKSDEYYMRFPVACDNKEFHREDGKPITFGEDCFAPVPVTELKVGDRVGMVLGSFDFEFMDSPSRMHDLYVLPDGVRPCRLLDDGMRGKRPYTVYQLKLLEKLESIISDRTDLTSSTLRNIILVLSSRYAEWNLGHEERNSEVWVTYRQFARDVIDKELALSFEEREFILSTVLSGLFFDWFEVFCAIEKRKLRSE